MSVTPDTSKCSEGHRDGVIVGAAYTHTHTDTSSFPLPRKRLTNAQVRQAFVMESKGALRHEGGRERMRGKRGERGCALTIILLLQDERQAR